MIQRRYIVQVQNTLRWGIAIQGRYRSSARDNSTPAGLPGRDALNMLDGPNHAMPKLNVPLVKEEKIVRSDPRSDGVLEATAEEVMDDLNQALTTSQLANIFKFVRNTSEVMEITKVVLNKDLSHADASWHSDYLEGFLRHLLLKDGLSASDLRLGKKMLKNVTNKLQSSEGKFRSHIIRSMNFRRVPRIFFRPGRRMDDALERIEVQLDRNGVKVT